MMIFSEKSTNLAVSMAKRAGIANKHVAYRFYCDFYGVAALKPVTNLIEALGGSDVVCEYLPEGERFEPGDTILVLEGKFEKVAPLQTIIKQWIALPCYTARNATAMTKRCESKLLFENTGEVACDIVSSALAAYGAGVGGADYHCMDINANFEETIQDAISHLFHYKDNTIHQLGYSYAGMGYMPQDILALYRGDYDHFIKDYQEIYKNAPLHVCVDYNSKEIDDALLSLEMCGLKLKSIIVSNNDAPMQGSFRNGVSPDGVKRLRKALNKQHGTFVQIMVKGDLTAKRITSFMKECPNAVKGFYTSGMAPEWGRVHSHIFKMEKVLECPLSKGWCFLKNADFYERLHKYYSEENKGVA